MKKLHLNSIRNTLSISKNKLGLSLDSLYKSHPYTISYDIFSSLLSYDPHIEITPNKIVQLSANYYSTPEYAQFEQNHYNSNYLKTLFKEETNTIKISIYKLLVDTPNMTYNEISKEMLRLYDVRLDIKQVSHYCMELMKIKLIISNQSSTIEKVNNVNNVRFEYEASKEHPGEKNEKFIRNNICFDYKLCHDPLTILHYDTKELLSENKLFLSNRFSFIIDESEIKNNILFHLWINRVKGLTANEICLLCDFVGREKTLNKIISSLESKGDITHKVLREGKKMEFVYFILNESEIDEKIKKLGDFYIKAHTHKNLIKKDSFKEEEENEDLSERLNNSNLNFCKNFGKIEKNEILYKSVLIPSSVNHFEKLNSVDYNYILSLLSKEQANEEDSAEKQKKNIMSFLSSYIESSKNFSNSSYNRYVFILNQIQEKKVLTLNDIKHLILTILEKEKDFVIDRKTIKRMFVNLEKMKLIKIIKFELTMKNIKQSYLNEKEEIKQEKLIALRRDMDENDKEMLADIIERLKPQKKSQISSTNTMTTTVEEKDPIKEEIDFIKQKAGNDLKITEAQRNISILIDKMIKIFSNNTTAKNVLNKFNFIHRLKRKASVKRHIDLLFERKDFLSSSLPSVEKLYTYIEGAVPSNIIVPQYILSKKIKSNEINHTSEHCDRNNDIFKFYSNNYSKGIFKKINFESYNGNAEIDKSFLRKKRKFDEGYMSIDKNKFDYKKWNKLIDIYELIKEIYVEPGITFYTLKRKMHLSNEYDGAETEILAYLKKMGIITIENKKGGKCYGTDNICDTSSISIDQNYKLFIEIYL